MIELIKTNDLVFLSWIEALLTDAEIPYYLLDSHTSIMQGSIGAIPRRLMVDDGDIDLARRVLQSAGIEIPLQT